MRTEDVLAKVGVQGFVAGRAYVSIRQHTSAYVSIRFLSLLISVLLVDIVGYFSFDIIVFQIVLI